MMIAIEIQNQYIPDSASAPGETLQELLEERDMTQAELARRTGKHVKTINEIIQGKAPITPETALQFERVLGTPASFWNNRERNYREALARLQDDVTLQQQMGWFEQPPIKKLIKALTKQGWIKRAVSKIDQLRELLSFFGVASVEQYKLFWEQEYKGVAFRQSTALKITDVAVTAWLRQGEIEAQAIDCQPFDASVFRQKLATIRALTREGPDVFQQQLVECGAACGVIIVFVPELPETGVCGATRWLTPNKALIQLSLRYKTDDHFWFTFFHEAGHILLHGKREIFLETSDSPGEKEEAANHFAGDLLIPPSQLKHFLASNPTLNISREAIEAFASQLGIAPGIIVGRLQHDKLMPYQNYCNDLKRRFSWADEIQVEEISVE